MADADAVRASQTAGRHQPSSVTLCLKFPDKGADRIGMLRKIQHCTLTECIRTFTRHTTQTMPGQQAFKGVEQPQLRIAFAQPGLEQPQSDQAQ